MPSGKDEDCELMQPPRAENAEPAVYPDSYKSLAERMNSGLAAHLGIHLVEVRPGYLCAKLEIAPHHMAANGYLHAGTLVTLADTACGFGCFASLPTGANNFTTIELKSNFLRTATQGTLRAEAHLVHGGRRTQVWDATVYVETGSSETGTSDGIEAENTKALAIFRCTQMILYPQRYSQGE